MPFTPQAAARLIRRRFLRTGLAALVAAVLFWGLYVQQRWARQAEQRLADALQVAGGRVDLRPPLRSRLEALYRRQPANGTEVFLGDGIDDTWIEEHGYLVDLPIDGLTIGNAQVTAPVLARLLSVQPVKTFYAGGETVTDDVVAALADNANLQQLMLGYSGLTDAQLERLPLEQLEQLDVAGTQVTSAGLKELRRCSRLTSLSIDGKQFTADAVSTLQSLFQLTDLTLAGSNVTRDHLAHLPDLQQVERVRLWYSRVTENELSEIQKSAPRPRINW